MFCAHCGSQLSPGARFCTTCGTPLEAAAPQQPQQTAQQPQQTAQQPQQTVQQPSQQPQPSYQQPVQQAYTPQQPYQPQQQYQPRQQTYTAPQSYQQPSGYVPYASAPVPPSAGGYGAYAAGTAVSAGTKGLRTWVKALIAIIIVAAIAVGGYLIYQHVFDKDAGIKKTLNNFETAYNRMDLNGVLDCLDPTYTTFLNGITSLMGGLTGFDVSSVLDGMLAIAPYLPDEVMGSERPTIDLNILSIDYIGNDSADVTIDFDLSVGDYHETGTDTIRMIKIDGTWYISLEGALW